MALVLIQHPQSRANVLRETLRWDPAVRRAGIRFLKVEGTDDALEVLVRNGDRTVRIGRGRGWRAQPLERLKESLRTQLTTLPGSRRRHRAAPRRWSFVTPFPPSKLRARTAGAGAATVWLLAPLRQQAPVLVGPRGPPGA